MKLILAQYLRTLKERNEFDSLLPNLLLAMGYVPISRPQTGPRQYGVDLAVVGKSKESKEAELLLFAIKRGDIGRSEWNGRDQSVRPTLDDILDVYLDTHVEPEHKNHKKIIILATTGDLKQDTQLNWDQYILKNSNKAYFAFWSGDKVASLMEEYLLDEHIFSNNDRSDLRKALALSGDHDYNLTHLNSIFLRQLDLDFDGNSKKPLKEKYAIKALRTINLATQIFSHWAEDEGNLKQALFASERALLWSWHFAIKYFKNKKKIYQEIGSLWSGYQRVSHRYFQKLEPYFYVRDGLTGGCRESTELAIVVFEQIGIISSIGLAQVMIAQTQMDDTGREISWHNSKAVANALMSLLENNDVSGSPALDEHVIDITLAFSLLAVTENQEYAKGWLASLINRINYTFIVQRHFPICTDSLDDLVEFISFEKEEDKVRLSSTSWIVPCLAGWAVLLGRDDLYEALSEASKAKYSEVCLQLWHPTPDYINSLYFKPSQYEWGEAEAPIILPESAEIYKKQMQKLLSSERHNVFTNSPSLKSGMFALDLIASRHFRTPIAPYLWYQLGGLTKQNTETEEAENNATAN